MITAVATYDWQDRAACSGMRLEDFFPEYDSLIEPAVVAACHRCPVREVCLAWALETGQDYGIWGGLTEEQRRQISKTRSRVRCPDCRSESIIDTGRTEVCIACGLSWPV